ncbi:uncharacterized protein J4E88_000108 [Alternaria novae-zelandiae]|uniref:uncharacterized protein n=1 Tax=Alternaria novae-zelandiae TaxID=430562 RepID=UPI0020C4A4BE|nr:uncharacterized protein J4E88_000108 [Alternaria novae-zelandiae]KAI4695938.1 hypothetical protein J4E88_000108 [Alternaria novae-zelandiae]
MTGALLSHELSQTTIRTQAALEQVPVGERGHAKEQFFLDHHRKIAEIYPLPLSAAAAEFWGSADLVDLPSLTRSHITGRIIPRQPNMHPRMRAFKTWSYKDLTEDPLEHINHHRKSIKQQYLWILELEWELYATVEQANDKDRVIEQLEKDNERLLGELIKLNDWSAEYSDLITVLRHKLGTARPSSMITAVPEQLSPELRYKLAAAVPASRLTAVPKQLRPELRHRLETGWVAMMIPAASAQSSDEYEELLRRHKELWEQFLLTGDDIKELEAEKKRFTEERSELVAENKRLRTRFNELSIMALDKRRTGKRHVTTTRISRVSSTSAFRQSITGPKRRFIKLRKRATRMRIGCQHSAEPNQPAEKRIGWTTDLVWPMVIEDE